MAPPTSPSTDRSPKPRDERPLIIRMYDPTTKAKDEYGRTVDDIRHWSDGQLERSHNYIQVLFPLPEGSMFSFNAPIINREVVEAFRGSTILRDRLRSTFERMLAFYGFAVTSEPPEELRENDVEPAAETSGFEKTDGKRRAGDEVPITSGSAGYKRKLDAAHATAPQQIDNQANTAVNSVTPALEELTSAPLSGNKVPAAAEKPVSPNPLTGYIIIRGPNWTQASRNWAVRMDHNHLRITRILRCLRVLGLHTECEAFYTALERVYNDPTIHISDRSLTFWQRAVRQPLHIAPDGERVGWLKKWVQQEKEHHVVVERDEKGENKPKTGEDAAADTKE